MKPRLPARLSTMHRESLTNEFLSHYATDQKFVGELQALVGKYPKTVLDLLVKNNKDVLIRLAKGCDIRPPLHPSWVEVDEEARWGTGEALRAFRDELDRLVRRWNLHILPGHTGHDAALGACLLLVAHVDKPVYDTPIHMYVTTSHGVPYVAGYDLSTDGKRTFTFTITVDGTWDPRTEMPGNARERLLEEFKAQLDVELATISDRMTDDAKYTYPSDSKERHKHMRWLYRRVAYRDSVDLIADLRRMDGDQFGSVHNVKRRTRELADALGIYHIPTAK